MTKDPREGPGWQVLAAALAIARQSFGARLASAYAVGSLAHGGFASSVSDVDLVLLFGSDEARLASDCEDLRVHVAAASPEPLYQRLDVYWSSWPALDGEAPTGRLPLRTRLDLVRAGRCLYGEDRRETIRLPETQVQHERHLIDAAHFMLEHWTTPGYTGLLRQPARFCDDLRAVTRAVLRPVRFL